MRLMKSEKFKRWTAAVWPITLGCIVVGVILGAATYLSGGHTATAQTMIRVTQPTSPADTLSGRSTSADDTQGFVSGEVAYLASPGFAKAVGAELGVTTPAQVTAAQNAQSSTITISATGSDEGEAVRTARAALTTYTDHAKQQLTERGTSALNAIDAVIDQQGGAGTDLRAQRAAIRVELVAGPPIDVVQAPTAVPATGLKSWILSGVIGGLLGGLLGFSYATLWRRRQGIVVSTDSVSQIATVITPEISLPNQRDSALSATDKAAGRSLYAQLAPHPSDQSKSPSIVVIGASNSSGSSWVHKLLSAATKELPVDQGVPVVEVKPLGECVVAGDVIRRGSIVAVVVKRLVNTRSELEAILQAVSADATVRVVLTAGGSLSEGSSGKVAVGHDREPSIQSATADDTLVAAEDNRYSRQSGVPRSFPVGASRPTAE